MKRYKKSNPTKYIFWCKNCHYVEASKTQTLGIMHHMNAAGSAITCIKCKMPQVVALKVSEEFHDTVLQNSYKGNITMSPHHIFDQLL